MISTKLLTRITSNNQYIPFIDGLRFLSIFMVILFHFYDYYRDRAYPFEISDELNSLVLEFTSTGFHGVMLFFGISGFVLGSPFVRQYVYGGKKVIIKDYLLRRVTRLEPPYIILLTGFFLLSLITNTKGGFVELFPHYLASLFYSHNAIYDGYPVLSDVLWSLEVEIQFYILAPLLALVFKLNKLYRRIILLFIILFYSEYIRSYIDPFVFKSLFKYLEYFLAGFLAADIYFEYKDKFKPKLVFDFIAVISLFSIWTGNSFFPLSFNVFLLITSTAFSMYFIKLLSIKWITIIGGMCYTIYMIHQRLLYAILGSFKPKELIADSVFIDVLVRGFIYLIPLSICTIIFFIFVERPTMKRDWWKYRSLKKLFFE